MLQINLYYTLFLLLSTMCYSLTSGAWIALKSNEDPWKQGKCREKSDGGKTFYVPNVGHIECSLNSCPLTGRAVYGIDYCCFTCCWANITGCCMFMLPVWFVQGVYVIRSITTKMIVTKNVYYL